MSQGIRSSKDRMVRGKQQREWEQLEKGWTEHSSQKAGKGARNAVFWAWPNQCSHGFRPAVAACSEQIQDWSHQLSGLRGPTFSC